MPVVRKVCDPGESNLCRKFLNRALLIVPTAANIAASTYWNVEVGGQGFWQALWGGITSDSLIGTAFATATNYDLTTGNYLGLTWQWITDPQFRRRRSFARVVYSMCPFCLNRRERAFLLRRRPALFRHCGVRS